MDHLDFVEQDVDLSGERAEPGPEVFAEPDRIAQGFVLVLVERQRHDVLRRNARFEKMPPEQVEEQVALPAPANARHDLHQAVSLAIDQFPQVFVPLDFHLLASFKVPQIIP